MTLKNAFRLANFYQVITAVAILCAIGCLIATFYKVSILLFAIAGISTIVGVRHMTRLYARCKRIEQGYGDPEGAR